MYRGKGDQTVTPDPHPCPMPAHPRKGARDGDLWACLCGRVYVRRHWWNYAGDGFDWKPTSLVLEV